MLHFIVLVTCIPTPDLASAIINGVGISMGGNPAAIANYWTNFGLSAGGLQK